MASVVDALDIVFLKEIASCADTVPSSISSSAIMHHKTLSPCAVHNKVLVEQRNVISVKKYVEKVLFVTDSTFVHLF